MWRGVAGDAGKAADHLRDLLEARRCGSIDDNEVFELHSDIAYGRGESGDTRGVLESFEQLLANVAVTLGPDDFHTL